MDVLSNPDQMNAYIDWRRVMGMDGNVAVQEFSAADVLIEEAWKVVLECLESRWQQHLLVEEVT